MGRVQVKWLLKAEALELMKKITSATCRWSKQVKSSPDLKGWINRIPGWEKGQSHITKVQAYCNGRILWSLIKNWQHHKALLESLETHFGKCHSRLSSSSPLKAFAPNTVHTCDCLILFYNHAVVLSHVHWNCNCCLVILLY